MRTQILAVALLSCLGLAACDRSPTGTPYSQAPGAGSPAEPTVGQKIDDAAISVRQLTVDIRRHEWIDGLTVRH